jgi:hypothetical protein
MTIKMNVPRFYYAITILLIAFAFFVPTHIAHAGTTVTQVDANGNTYDPNNANNPRLLAGSSLYVYIKVTNNNATTLSSVGVSVGGVICAGVSSVIVNTGTADIASGASRTYQITINANATVTNISCNTMTVSDTSPAPSSAGLKFEIGAAPAATATPAVTPTTVGSAFCTGETDDPPSNLQTAKIIMGDIEYNQGLCYAGDVDAFSIGFNRDKVYNIEITKSDSGLDLIMELYDPLFRLVAVSDDFYEHSSANSTNIDPQIPNFRAPMDGVYYIRIRDATGYGGYLKSTYSIKVGNQSYGGIAPDNTGVCTDKYEPDGLPEQARLILSNQRQADHRLCPTGDADWIMFFAKAGNTYYLYTDTRSYSTGMLNDQLAGTDTVLTLFERDGVSFIATNDNADTSTFDSQIRFQPTSDGFYFAQVKNIGDIGGPTIKYDVVNELCKPGNDACGRSLGEALILTPTPTAASELIQPSPTVDINVQPTTVSFELANVRNSGELFNGALKTFVDRAFEVIWNRSDRPIARQQVSRSWLWGPTGLMARSESYLQVSGGLRQVQYFDKGRMEINNPNANRQSSWYVTSGLLVHELITGRMQVGNNEFVEREPSNVPIAGDPGDTVGPTYASFNAQIGIRGPNRTGESVDQRIMRDGSVIAFSGVSTAATTFAKYIPETGHNIPQVFYDYLTKRDTVYVNGRTTQGLVMDWVYTMGYPISEPYWTRATIGGSEQWVLVQPFERRVLTYVPTNPSAWQVEQGNVGRHYYRWRYGNEPS